MTVFLTLTTAGADSGPFDLYSDVDSYASPFETGLTRSQLLAGYSSALVPDFSTTIKVKSTSKSCPNFIEIPIGS